MLARVGTDAICIICLFVLCILNFQHYGSCSQDQTSQRANTLRDDADDIQRQLDNEARDRIKYGRAKTIWVLRFPTRLPPIGSLKYITSRIRRTESKTVPKKEKEDPSKHQCFDPKLDTLEPKHANEIILADEVAADISWDYRCQVTWKAKFPKCGGCHQSPMVLPVTGLAPVQTGVLTFCNFHVQPSSMTLSTDNHRITLYGDWPGNRRPTLFGGILNTRRYIFDSLVFHVPSEHMVGVKRYPVETQAFFVATEYHDMADAMAATEDHQAILAVSSLYNYANFSQPALEPIIEEALYMSTSNESVQLEPLVNFIPVFSDYACYHGSLPVPPCTEVVLWMVPARTLPVTKRAVEIAHSHVSVNGLPTCTLRRIPQKTNDRKVFYCKSEIQISQSLFKDQN